VEKKETQADGPNYDHSSHDDLSSAKIAERANEVGMETG
jgi:hypothetical protein